MSAKKKTTTKTKVTLPDPSETELELTELVADAARQQYEQISQQMRFQNQLFTELMGVSQAFESQLGGGGSLYGGGAEAAAGGAAGTALLGGGLDAQRNLEQGAATEILGLELERARTGVATPEQAAALRQAADLAFAAGSSDIETAATRQIQALQRELAPTLGLRGQDSPIVERGGRIGEEAVRQIGQLSRNVRTAEQQALVDASLRQGALNQGVLDLSQRAFQNRISLLGEAGRLGLGVAGIGNPLGALQVIQQPRLAQTTTRSRTTESDPLGSLIALTGAAGGLLSSAGSIAGSFSGGGGGAAAGGGGGGYSSIALKNRWGAVPAAEWAHRLSQLPIEFWSYKSDPEATVHAGLYAEHFREAFGFGDGETIDYLDAIGVLFAVLKHLLEERRA